MNKNEILKTLLEKKISLYHLNSVKFNWKSFDEDQEQNASMIVCKEELQLCNDKSSTCKSCQKS